MDAEHDRLNGPRALVYGCSLGLLLWALIGIASYAIARADGPGDAYLAGPILYTLPRPVHCDPQFADICQSAVARWNAIHPGTFALTDDPAAQVQVTSTNGRTWVQMPLTGPSSVVYLGTDVDVSYWLAHELGHTLNLRDHIWPSMDATGYVNPAYTTDGYRGVMSYASSPAQWFGPDDVYMMDTLFPLPFHAYAPILSP